MNTALMESITNMSEYFVAANTRTSFTELAESGSLSSIAGHSNQSSLHHQANLGQQFAPTGSPNQLHKTLLTSNSHLHQQPHHHHIIHHQQHQQLHNSNPNNSHSNNGGSNNNNGNTNHSNNSTNPSPLHHLHSHCNQTQHQPYHNHGYSPSNNHNNSNNNNINNANNATSSSSSGSSLQSTRLSQPVRTQIPIHCYIEQLDACADVPCFGPPLNDADLFNTTNNNNDPNKLTSGQSQQQQQQHQAPPTHQTLSNSPQLNQSKLALESITNGNTSGLSSIRNSSGLFNENDTTDNDNNDHDSNLDHINSNSPISIGQTTSAQSHQQQHHHQQQQHQQNTTNNKHQTNSICGNNSNNNNNNNCFIGRQAAPVTHVKHHFQSCRETYAIVTSNVLYIDLVRTVLLQLGYSAMDLINAKGKLGVFVFLRLYFGHIQTFITCC